MDFLLVLIELSLLGVTADALRAKIDRESEISLQRFHFDPKFQVQGVAPTNNFCIFKLSVTFKPGHTGSYDYRIAWFVRKSADARPVSYFRHDMQLRSHICDRFETDRTTGCTTGGAIQDLPTTV